MIFPSLTRGKIYSEAFHNLYEYLDIKNIVKKLQDIDKLKMILFDEKQRNAFESLPKPGVGKKKNYHSTLTMENIVKPRNTISPDQLKFSYLLDGNPINLRIYDLLDPKLKRDPPQEAEDYKRKTKKIFFQKKK